jgi:serine/threonine protein kinase/Tol biopolymer transport system component
MGDGARLAAARNGTRGEKGSDVTPERWQEVKKVLAAVLEKTPEERTAYLDRADAEPDVRREVKSLLLAEKRAKSSFLAQPAVTPQPELATGNRLGAYEIVARIGAGGMGEVYQARDTKLGRSVAIKVLPLAFVEDQDRLARFQREARVLASLNHPNIATIYGLEQSGSTPYLVMELIPGETLAEQLKSGRLDIAKALGIAQQIAAALESAHEQGIVHRDLKPANIEVTPDGRVKVLDFGLAKPLAGVLDGNAEESAGKTAASEPGIILGTPAYMSPEQVRGKAADKRADIWAFGCVLYEMLSGRRLFDGDSITEMLAEVLSKEPDWAGLPKTTPASIQRLIRRCLVKDPKQRLRDIGDARIAIEEERSGVEGPAMAGTVAHALELDHGSSVRLLAATVARRHSRTLAIGVAAFVLSIVTLVYWFSPPLPPPSVSDYTQLSNDGHLKWLAGTDGSRIYVEEGFGDAYRLTQVSVAGGEASKIVIPTSAMCAVSFSSDASSMLMIDGRPSLEGQFWALPTLGGSARQLAGARGHAGSWSPDRKKLAYANGNDLFVANADGTAPKKIFSSVDAVATVPSAAIPPGPRSIALPSIAWSSDGSKLRFTVTEANLDGSIWQISSDGSNPAPLFPNWHPPGGECCGNWTADGKYFIFESQYQMWARRETSNLVQKVSREPVQLTDGSTTYVSPLPSKDGKQIFAVSGFARGELERYDATAKTFQPYLGGISAQDVAFSNDGQWVAYVSFPNGTLSRSRVDGSDKLQLSFPPLYATFPQWSPDGKQVLFSAFERGKLWRIYLVAAEGGAPQELMPDDETMQTDPSWSPDGSSFVFGGIYAASRLRIFNMKTHRISMLAGSQGLSSPRWSPDGRYIAAQTAGEYSLMLYDFNAQKWSVLAKQGTAYPSWSRRGDYVYFLGGPTWTVKRVGVRARKVEPLISLEGFPITGYWGFWLGLLPDDSPLVLKDTGTQDVVSLTFHEP